MKRVIFILACAVAVVAFHGLGAQQTIDDTRARSGCRAAHRDPSRAAAPQCLSIWFVQDVPGASAGDSRANPTALSRFAKGVRRLPRKTSRRIVAAERARFGQDAAGRLHAVLHRGCARGSRAIRRSGRGVRLDDDVAPGRDSARSHSPSPRRKSRWRGRIRRVLKRSFAR